MTANKNYDNEREGQIEFFQKFNIPYDEDDSILIDYTDGVYHGNILEFKLNINNTGKALFQAIKYLSRMRIKGESVPARILLVDLNLTTVYVYNSIDYIDDIQKVYIGAASSNNDAFNQNVSPIAKYDYMNITDAAKVLDLLINEVEKETDWYIPIDIDENCVIGWAQRYYREVFGKLKEDFLGDGDGKVETKGEIREPKHFKGLINPYTEPTNEKFKYLMDCLNDRLNKKDLGAFYTPKPYCEKASELVEKAVQRALDAGKKDYIILDRCAGTGNLEAALIGKYDKNGSELISHCIVSTYEYYEYKVLSERIGDKVRNIIPATEADVIYKNGKVSNADAMSKDFIDNPLIKRYINNDECTIILFENPPYQDSTAVTFNDETGKKAKARRTESFINTEYRKITATLNEGKASAREISNLFIWSGFKYYLRQDTDSYILFSPVKYFKNVGLARKIFLDGFLFNRKFFHATESTIGCILWSNIDDLVTETILLPAYNIVDNEAQFETKVAIKKVHNTFINYYDKRTFPDDKECNVWCGSDGNEMPFSKRIDIKSVYNDNIICALGAPGFNLDAMKRCLVRQQFYRHGLVFYIRKDNYLIKLPLWVAKLFPQDNWYDKDVYNTTSDGGDAYTKDGNFLKSCLLYTCLSNQNKCLSFNGSDGRYYRNELCFDATNGSTVASTDIAKMDLDSDEQELMNLWKNILEEAKKTANYNDELTYGVYQITKELNTFEKPKDYKKKVYHYPTLNGYLITLRSMLKDYYKSHITDKMFEYELLK